MMTVITDAFLPYEFAERHNCFNYIVERCLTIKNSLRRIEKDNEHLTVRCPLSGDYLEVVGSEQDLDWLDNELRRKQWYRK